MVPGRSGGGSWAAFLGHVGVWVHYGFATSTMKHCDDGGVKLHGVCEMCDDTNESPAQLGWRRRRPWVSSSSLDAPPKCVGIYLTHLDLFVVFGRKPQFGVGSARWRRW
jgi:hypothetical protein